MKGSCSDQTLLSTLPSTDALLFIMGLTVLFSTSTWARPMLGILGNRGLGAGAAVRLVNGAAFGSFAW